MRHALTSVLLIGTLALGGCFYGGNRDVTTNNTTLGQELIDLDLARQAGALTEDEYQLAKARLLDEN
jgi:hypothetical protein